MSLDFFDLDLLQELARLYGYWAVFIGIAIENMGIPLPGETIVIVGGFLAGSGELNYWWVRCVYWLCSVNIWTRLGVFIGYVGQGVCIVYVQWIFGQG